MCLLRHKDLSLYFHHTNLSILNLNLNVAVHCGITCGCRLWYNTLWKKRKRFIILWKKRKIVKLLLDKPFNFLLCGRGIFSFCYIVVFTPQTDHWMCQTHWNRVFWFQFIITWILTVCKSAISEYKIPWRCKLLVLTE